MKMKTYPSKKRGRPRKAEKPEDINKKLLDDNLRLVSKNFLLEGQISKLNHQIIGFRAVISYLESHLKLESSQ